MVSVRRVLSQMRVAQPAQVRRRHVVGRAYAGKGKQTARRRFQRIVGAVHGEMPHCQREVMGSGKAKGHPPGTSRAWSHAVRGKGPAATREDPNEWRRTNKRPKQCRMRGGKCKRQKEKHKMQNVQTCVCVCVCKQKRNNCVCVAKSCPTGRERLYVCPKCH